MGGGTRPAGGRGVLEGAFALLQELAHSGELGLTRLAANAGLPKSTAHALLAQLVAVGAVQRQDGRYRIGPQLFRLGQAWQPAPILRAAAQHPLRQLAAAVNRASISVVVPDAGRMMVIGGMRGEMDAIVPLRAGTVLPPGTSAEMLLATEPSGTTPECYSAREWKRLVTGAHERGVAFNYQVSTVPVAAVSAPVREPSGKVVAAVGVTVLDGRRLAGMAEAVQSAANKVSANLARLPAQQSSALFWGEGPR